ncbi:MAG: dihydroorotase, partial [Burkholderiaceae bacterium]|nr:dihydroorotase [Burkholderiaceae bacterium]
LPSLYAEAFDSVGQLDRLEAFASFFGPDYYGLPRNQEKITLLQKSESVPFEYPMGDSILVPLRAGETIAWSVAK